jgi:lysophospholipase L1-like esterase
MKLHTLFFSTFTLLCACFYVSAAPVDKKLAVIGSSVPRGYGAYTTGTYLGPDLDGNGSPDTFALRGYAGLIKSYVEAQGWTFENLSVGGDSTSDVLARIGADLVPQNPEVVLIGLSMGNEGLTFSNDPQSVLESFETGMLQIIQDARDEGYYPVVGLVYPNRLYDLEKYDYVKRMNLIMNTWDVPSINLLGAIDNGSGRWAEGFVFDDGHPNVPGHEEMYHAVVPSLFDAIDQGKTAVPTYPSSNAFLRLTQDAAQAAPLTYTPAETLRAFTNSFKVRSGVQGTVAAVRMGTKPLFLIDFGPSDDVNGRATVGADAFGNYWNSWRPATGGVSIPIGTSLSNLVTVDNVATTVGLEVTDAFSGSNGILSGGLDAGDGPTSEQLGTLAVETATEDYFFDSGTGAFKLTGLDPSKRYTFRMFGTRQSTDTRETRFTISGGMSYSPFAFLQTSGDNIGSNRSYDGNDDSIVMISGVEPTAGGEITLTMAPEQGGFAYLGALEVFVDEPAPTSRYATIELRDTELAYVAPDGREITASIDADDGSWHEVALAHRYAQQETLLFLDGRFVGALRESLDPDQFILGGSGMAGTDSPTSADYQDWCVYRAAWTEEEALAQHQGAFQQASLEICAALDDGSFTNGHSVTNRAQSLSTAVINTANAAGPSAVTPPSALAARSQAVDSVELSWVDNSSTETGFVIERRAYAEGGGWELAGSVAANVTSFDDTGLGAGIRYSYRVSSSESGLQSGYSNIATVSVGEDGRSYQAWISDFYQIQPASYRIDFNDSASPDYGGEIWNTVSSLTATTAYPLVDTNNDGSAGYSVRLRQGFDQSRTENGNPLVGYDDDAQRTSFITTDTELGSAVIVLSGLDSNLQYDLGLFCNRGVVVGGFDYKARYTITGASGQVIYDHDNALSTDVVEVYSIRPDAGGSISIQIDPTDTPGGTFFAGINFLTLTEVRRPYLIDFNADTTPTYVSGETWNTIHSPAVTTPYSLIDVEGDGADGYTLAIASPFTTTREGDGASLAGGIVDVSAESNLFALTGSIPAEIRIGGLDVGLSYGIVFLAKRNAAVSTFDYSATYTVTGAGAPVSHLINADDNSEWAVFSRVVPNASGEIVVEAAPNTDPGTPTNEFVVLNALRLVVDGAASGDLPSAGSDEDSDADGALNFLEYALGRDPTVDDASPVTLDAFNLNATATQATFQFRRFSAVQGITFELQHKADLLDVEWLPLSISTESVVGTAGMLDTIEVLAPISGDSGFFRLSIRQ